MMSYFEQCKPGHSVPPGRVEGNVPVVREVWGSGTDHPDSAHCHHVRGILRPEVQRTPTVSSKQQNAHLFNNLKNRKLRKGYVNVQEPEHL